MTPQEAIEILKDLRIYDDDCETDVEALTIAIDTLDKLEEGKLIELPCKVGDTVYYITGIGHNLIKPAKIKEIILDDSGIKDLYVQGDGFNFENPFDIFYLTKEQAEKTLEGSKNV